MSTLGASLRLNKPAGCAFPSRTCRYLADDGRKPSYTGRGPSEASANGGDGGSSLMILPRLGFPADEEQQQAAQQQADEMPGSMLNSSSSSKNRAIEQQHCNNNSSSSCSANSNSSNQVLPHSLLSLAASSGAAAPAHHPAVHPPPPSTTEERGLLLIQLLFACAAAVAARDISAADSILRRLSALACPTGDPMQRVASHFCAALAAAAAAATWPGIAAAISATSAPAPPEAAAARRALFGACPYAKFSMLASNQAVLDAMSGERVVHVIDLGRAGAVGGGGGSGGAAVQWRALLHAFHSRPEGAPFLRITAVADTHAAAAAVAGELQSAADRLDIPFQFHAVVGAAASLTAEALGVKIGEAVAVTSLMQLHRLLAPPGPAKTPSSSNSNSNSNSNERKRKREEEEEEEAGDRCGSLLKLLHSLAPKVVVMVEQESSHNSERMLDRFGEALHYYSAVFDSVQAALPAATSDRAAAERLVLGQEISNIVAANGAERVERHESLASWRRRLEWAGFRAAPLSPTTVVQAERLLGLYVPDRYKLRRDKGALTLCWQRTPLFSLSAWEPGR